VQALAETGRDLSHVHHRLELSVERLVASAAGCSASVRPGGDQRDRAGRVGLCVRATMSKRR